MSLDQRTIPIALGLGSLALIAYVIGSRREADNHPPGPPAFPIFGNALGWPAKESWKVFFEWSKRYGTCHALALIQVLSISSGDLVYATVFTRRIVIINSTSAVEDLLDKRAATYSHRPYLYLYEVSNRQLGVFNITTEHERFRLYRKLLHSELGPRSISNYSELLRRQTLLMLKRISTEPEGFYGFIRMFVSFALLFVSAQHLTIT
jgi:cytochrome P450